MFTRLTIVKVFWIPLLVLANVVMVSAIIHRDAIPLTTLLGIGALTFYADVGGALVFLARDAGYYLAGVEPPPRGRRKYG